MTPPTQAVPVPESPPAGSSNLPTPPLNLSVADSNMTAWEIAQRSPSRNLKEIWESLKDELKFSPESVGKYWYSIPYRDNRTNTVVPIEGIGIHGAMAILRYWGHNASGGGVSQDLGDKVICRGIFYDHKNNGQDYREVIVNRYQVSAGGKTYRLNGKHWDNAIQSGISKAKRNAALEYLPEFIKSLFFSLCKELTLNTGGDVKLTIKEKLEAAEQSFIKKFKITHQIFMDYMSGLSVESDEEAVTHLKGLYNTLVSGETTLQETFGVTPEGSKVMTPPVEVPNAESDIR